MDKRDRDDVGRAVAVGRSLGEDRQELAAVTRLQGEVEAILLNELPLLVLLALYVLPRDHLGAVVQAFGEHRQALW